MNKSQLTADLIKRTAKKQGLSISKLLIDCELNKNAIYTMQTEGDYLLGRTDKPDSHNL